LIAVDTSSLLAFFSGASGPDVEAVDAALATRQAILPPVVLTELLSDPKLDRPFCALIESLPLLELSKGYWKRAGELRQALLAKARKGRIADCLIAQSCIDHEVALITRDDDFRRIAKVAGLRLERL